MSVTTEQDNGKDDSATERKLPQGSTVPESERKWVSYQTVWELAVRLFRTGKRTCWNLKTLFKLVDKEIRDGPDIPIREKLRAYRNGFLSMTVPAYDLETNESKTYLSEWQREKARRINGDRRIIHEDKLAFYYTFCPEFPERLPTLYGYIDDHRFIETPFTDRSFRDLPDCVDRLGKVVVKPRDRAYGANVRVVEAVEGRYLINGNQLEIPEGSADLAEYFADGIVTEFANQAAYAREVYPGSANSIRIITMVDPDTREPFIAMASHRFGTERSTPVDNAAQGGLSTGIDTETGQLESTLKLPCTEENSEYYRHPETGTRIYGIQIPGWGRICDGILEMATYVAPLTPYIGWDVLVTDEDGSFQVLETNSSPDIVVQAHEPLLADERVVRFFEHHGVL